MHPRGKGRYWFRIQNGQLWITTRNQWGHLSLSTKTEGHTSPLLCLSFVPKTETGQGHSFPWIDLSLEAQSLCRPVLCVSPHGRLAHSSGWLRSRGGSQAGLHRREGVTWGLGREGEATTEKDSSGPLLRPLFPGLSSTGCQPLITHSAPETLVVPVTLTVVYRARPEPRDRW